MRHCLTGFGFGPIQAGLFVAEAFGSGRFDRIVISEIDAGLVDAIGRNRGRYSINVAHADRIETRHIDGVELLNPNDPADHARLSEALSQSTEIVTSLPSVSFYTAGDSRSVAARIADGLRNRSEPAIVYTAENNNHAAEILQDQVGSRLGKPFPPTVQFINTVIGKMSQVVTDSAVVRQMNLVPIAPGIEKAFLVEAFNRILVTRTTIPGFQPGIGVFVEKDDLLPFEEAKLFGHNAIHALLAYLAAFKGLTRMTEVAGDRRIMEIARRAFLDESGAALTRKYASLGDDLFSEYGYKAYAEDLLTRITNPWLNDTVERAVRDPIRKLAPNDRIFGTMSLALEYGIEPENMALGALAGLISILRQPQAHQLPDSLRCPDLGSIPEAGLRDLLRWVWRERMPCWNDHVFKCIIDVQDRPMGLRGP
jgi:mannitol-1-phosphate 5-dehydrogenase